MVGETEHLTIIGVSLANLVPRRDVVGLHCGNVECSLHTGQMPFCRSYAARRWLGDPRVSRYWR